MRPSLARTSLFAASLVAAWVLCAFLVPRELMAQDDNPSLGDVARDLRRNKTEQQIEQTQPLPPVIDNDNLPQAIQDVRRIKSAEKIVFSFDPEGQNFHLASADINCSLAFNGRSSSFRFQPEVIEDLPLADLLKLDGPGSIQDDTLQIEVSNGTEWELREITVGITLERSAAGNAELAARARVIPAAQNSSAATVERRSDMTLLFHLKANAKPFSSTIFRETIGITPTADEDWRWSIVSAKGIRPGTRLNPTEPLPPAATLPLPTAAPPAASLSNVPPAPTASNAASVGTATTPDRPSQHP